MAFCRLGPLVKGLSVLCLQSTTKKCDMYAPLSSNGFVETAGAHGLGEVHQTSTSRAAIGRFKRRDAASLHFPYICFSGLSSSCHCIAHKAVEYLNAVGQNQVHPCLSPMRPSLNCPPLRAQLPSSTATAAGTRSHKPQPTKDEQAPRAKEDAVRVGTITRCWSGATNSVPVKSSTKTPSRAAAPSPGNTPRKGIARPEHVSGAVHPAGINTYNHDATGLFGGG